MYGTPPGIPGLVQTNITNSAEEKWALLDKDIEMEDSETNENRNGRTILHHTISLHYNVFLTLVVKSGGVSVHFASTCHERAWVKNFNFPYLQGRIKKE